MNEKGKEKKLSELQIIRVNFKYKCDKSDKSDKTHFSHTAAVPKEEEVPAAQVHGQKRA